MSSYYNIARQPNNTLPEPVVLTGGVRHPRGPLTAQSLDAMIADCVGNTPDPRFHAPGPLTPLLRAEQGFNPPRPISPQTTLASVAACDELQSRLVSRKEVESKILACRLSDFACNGDNEIMNYNILHNGFPPMSRNYDPVFSSETEPYSPDQRSFSYKGAVSYLEKNLIDKNDSVLSIGSGKGHFELALLANGVPNITLVEPNNLGCYKAWDNIIDKCDYDVSIHQTTVEEYSKSCREKYSVVNAYHFCAVDGDDPFSMKNEESMIKAMASLTAEGGRALFGICHRTIGYISEENSTYLKPYLEECFHTVTFIDSFDDRYPYPEDGQMGIYCCTNPKKEALS